MNYFLWLKEKMFTFFMTISYNLFIFISFIKFVKETEIKTTNVEQNLMQFHFY